MNSANSQYIPLENEYILHLRLNISPSAYGYILAFSTQPDWLIADMQIH